MIPGQHVNGKWIKEHMEPGYWEGGLDYYGLAHWTPTLDDTQVRLKYELWWFDFRRICACVGSSVLFAVHILVCL